MSDKTPAPRSRARAPMGHQPLTKVAQQQMARNARRQRREQRELARLPRATRKALESWERTPLDKRRTITGRDRSAYPLLSRNPYIRLVKVTMPCGFCWRRPEQIYHTQCQGHDVFLCWRCLEEGRNNLFRKGSADAMNRAYERSRRPR